ncbi:unnamed protein product [Alternaria alternata]
MSVIYKRSEREREWDTTSARGSGAGYTTVRRYKVPDHSLEEDTYESEMRLVHRGRDDFEDRRSVKDYVIERHQEPAREVRHYHYTEREREVSPQRSEYRIQREYERSPSPARTEIRISRDYERDREIFPREQQPYELEKYSRSTEYFRPEPIPQPPPQPIYIRNEAPQPMQMQMQPIIIREEAPQPIIIRERIQEPAYELVERTTEEDRQVARPRHEEDYYYERRVKEIDRGGRYDERYADEREYDHRWGDKNYYSDDDVYIHKEKDTWGGSETRTKRDVAAGALAGVAAGQIIRHHRKRKGEAAGGNIGNALGYGTLGAVSAVALDRFNNRDRSRSVSSERGRGSRRGKSRHRSKSRVKELGTLAALAGVGALAYAAGQRNKNKTAVKEETVTVIEDRHRSRSRHGGRSRSRKSRGRHRSVSAVGSDRGRSRSTSKHLDPEHRNNRAAQVGLATAAVAGLAARSRSKSRKRKGKRSPSRIRQGVPIAAAGVAGAAVTGLYEKRKAKKEARAASRSKSRSRSRSRSVLSRLTGRSRSRRGSTVSEPVLVEYGGDPVYTDRPARSRSRSRSRDRSRSHRSRRRRSSSSSDGRSRSRSKSRARTVAETAAVAGVAGLAAHEAAKRRDRKKAEKEAERRREDDSAYSTGTYSPYDSPTPSTAHPNDSRFFPESNYFPPSPYCSSRPQPKQPIPSVQSGRLSSPLQAHMSQIIHRSLSTHRTKIYISAIRMLLNINSNMNPTMVSHDVGVTITGPVDEPRSPSPTPTEEKSVKFDLNPQEEPPREPSREPSPDSDREHRHRDDHSHKRHRRRKDDDRSDITRESGRARKRRHRSESPGSDASDATIELPPRFDERGRQQPEDPLAKQLESVLQSIFR